MSDNEEFQLPTSKELAMLDTASRATLAAMALEGLEPGRQPEELFAQFCRLTVASTVELVPIRIANEQPEVWLEQRSKDAPWWALKWVLPGVVVLPNDEQDSENSLAGPIARLFKTDLEGIRQADALHPLPSQFRFDGRGVEVTTQFWTRVETDDTPYKGRFFNLQELRQSEPEGGVLEEGWLAIDRTLADYKAISASAQH